VLVLVLVRYSRNYLDSSHRALATIHVRSQL
jgi:hypothetical protein